MRLGDNLQTTCQHCGSVFRITQEQLDAARGSVRCSQCEQVFDALVSLDNQHLVSSQVTRPEVLPTGARPDSVATDEPAPEPSPALEVSLKEAMYGTGHSGSTSGFKSFMWFMGILLLALLTLVQLIYYQRYPLIASSSYQQQVLNLCRLLPCNESRFSSLGQIKLIERNVFTHPTRAKALMISGSFQNKAPFSQAIPRLLISLSDISGRLIGNRTFNPDEYLIDTRIDTLAPGKVVQFRLEIADPGVEALTYEFEFVDD